MTPARQRYFVRSRDGAVIAGFDWLKHILFNDVTIAPRDSVLNLSSCRRLSCRGGNSAASPSISARMSAMKFLPAMIILLSKTINQEEKTR